MSEVVQKVQKVQFCKKELLELFGLMATNITTVLENQDLLVTILAFVDVREMRTLTQHLDHNFRALRTSEQEMERSRGAV